MTKTEYFEQLRHINEEIDRFINESHARGEWRELMRRKWADFHGVLMLYGGSYEADHQYDKD